MSGPAMPRRASEWVVRAGERELRVRVEPLGDDTFGLSWRTEADGTGRDVVVQVRQTHGTLSLLHDGLQHELGVVPRSHEHGVARYWVDDGRRVEEVEVLEPLAFLARRENRLRGGGGPRRIDAYMPGRVVQVLVAEGARVTAGQGVLVLEAMKMENEIAAEQAGTVTRILVEAGQAVEGGDPLFELAPE